MSETTTDWRPVDADTPLGRWIEVRGPRVFPTPAHRALADDLWAVLGDMDVITAPVTEWRELPPTHPLRRDRFGATP